MNSAKRGRELSERARAEVIEHVGRQIAWNDTFAMLQSRDWPGNVRELRGTIVRAVIEAPGGEITPADIVLGTPRSLPVGVLLSASYADAYKVLDQHFLPLVIDDAGYNISRIAERLGVSRQTVRALLRDHGLYPFDRPERHG